MSDVEWQSGSGGSVLVERLQVLLEQAVQLIGEHDLDAVLQQTVRSATTLVRGRYGALGLYSADGLVSTFVHHGMDDETVARIGHFPSGQGILGQVTAADGPVRVDDLSADSRSCGFPVHHPPMRTFLGVPVARMGRHYGNLYVTEKEDGDSFDATDEALVMALAAFAAGAIESARLVESERGRAQAVAREAAADERERNRRQMLAAVIAAQEAERARVSRDLHDDIGQALTSVLLGLRLIDSTERAGSNAEPGPVERLREIRELVADALQRTRRLAFDLRPTVLADVGLSPALDRLAAEVADRTGLAVDALIDGSVDQHEITSEVATVAYRVAQETLTNVVRHADATSASIAVTVAGDRLRLVVEDDGGGFDPAQGHDDHLGLLGMSERADLVGGTVAVSSGSGGTTVVLQVPVR